MPQMESKLQSVSHPTISNLGVSKAQKVRDTVSPNWIDTARDFGGGSDLLHSSHRSWVSPAFSDYTAWKMDSPKTIVLVPKVARREKAGHIGHRVRSSGTTTSPSRLRRANYRSRKFRLFSGWWMMFHFAGHPVLLDGISPAIRSHRASWRWVGR